MWEALNNLTVTMMDYVLGWILFLPRDVMLFAVAVMTSAILTFVRLWTTDQDWLGRADQDKKRLAQLIKQAKKAKDKEAVKRHKATVTLIKVRAAKYEFRPLLWAILPILLLATWAFSRLGYVPPRAGEPVELRMYVPNSAIGRSAHLAPEEGLAATEWVRTAVKDAVPEPATAWARFNAAVKDKLGMTPQPEGVVTWRVVPEKSGSHLLKFRFGGKTYHKDLTAGTRFYPVPATVYDDPNVQAVEVVMQPVELFGLVEGLDFLFLPPWLVAYLLIAIPFVSVLKRLCRVY